MKKFIITVDTEGDNLWECKDVNRITTYNASFIPRFQTLCESYDFKPVYLINDEMIHSSELVKYLKGKATHKKCEIGMHLHAWNTLPEYELPVNYSGLPYITEYPKEVIYSKHLYLKNKIEQSFECTPTSYRAGRWATNATLFEVLAELKFTVDCSVTPQIDHSKISGLSVSGGNNYTNGRISPYVIAGNLIEIPMTTRKIRRYIGSNTKGKIRNLIKGKDYWLRPAIHSVEELIYLVNYENVAHSDYLEFMIHSSELMPGGSIYTMDSESVEKLYDRMTSLFDYLKTNNKYEGTTLHDYYLEIKGK